MSGDAPRLEPLRAEDLTEDLLALVARMQAVNVAIESREQYLLSDVADAKGAAQAAQAEAIAKLPEIILTMLRHPALFSRLTELGIQLLGKGELPARERELVVLRGAWLCQAPYEFGEHVFVAKKAGVTSEEIDRLKIGSSAPGWSEHEAALMRAVEELHRDAIISDATWAILAQTYTDKQLIELPVVVGIYQATAYYHNSLMLRLHVGNRGLDARWRSRYALLVVS